MITVHGPFQGAMEADFHGIAGAEGARNCGPAAPDFLRLGGHDSAGRSGIRGVSPVLTGWRSAGEFAKRHAIRHREPTADGYVRGGTSGCTVV